MRLPRKIWGAPELLFLILTLFFFPSYRKICIYCKRKKCGCDKLIRRNRTRSDNTRIRRHAHVTTNRKKIARLRGTSSEISMIADLNTAIWYSSRRWEVMKSATIAFAKRRRGEGKIAREEHINPACTRFRLYFRGLRANLNLKVGCGGR